MIILSYIPVVFITEFLWLSDIVSECFFCVMFAKEIVTNKIPFYL